jgi:hypothetical protein
MLLRLLLTTLDACPIAVRTATPRNVKAKAKVFI